ncbi:MULTISPECIES: hypothetical protein [unclassified Endozoicomonas]|uniref:hypothetical protein n=1 Tax=unclassified Endozoicomonas TaxID=2644528 RepID=UPI0021492FC2|nr:MULTISPECIES: hypothetical protein [unclassified Endozoicomonas]
MLDRVNVNQALQLLSTSDNPAERQLAQDIFAQSGNGALGDLPGEGKRFAGLMWGRANE